MTEKEKRNKLKAIERALQEFPKIVKQNALRGRNHRKLMKAFNPVIDELLQQIRKKNV